MDSKGFRSLGVVGERNKPQRSPTETEGGALISENADMSSDKPDENSGRRKPKVSWARFVPPGLVGS
jgi:hypothetical protein